MPLIILVLFSKPILKINVDFFLPGNLNGNKVHVYLDFCFHFYLVAFSQRNGCPLKKLKEKKKARKKNRAWNKLVFYKD